MEKVSIGVVGLGQRGKSACCTTMLALEELAHVAAVCDVLCGQARGRRRTRGEGVRRNGRRSTKIIRDLLADPSLDAVLITAGWEEHIKIAIDSMNARARSRRWRSAARTA